jgi:hypothetical protein
MKQVLLISIFTISFAPLFSQKIIGNWKGNIEINGNGLPIVFHFHKNSAGQIEGKWDSPKQKAMGLPFTGINATDDSLNLDIKLISGSYQGKFIGQDSISGIWHQSGGGLPLNFSRSNEEEVIKSAPLLPGEKEISISTPGGDKLYGTLLSKNNQQKLAIIIAGSGPTDRDGNNPLGVAANSYRMLAYALDSQNIATFRFDKRGVGKSIPDDFQQDKLVFDNYVADVESIFRYLSDTLGFKNIYVIGHSEGSLIGILVSQKMKTKGFVSIAGAGRRIDKVIEEQLKSQMIPDSVQTKAKLEFDQLRDGKKVDEFSGPLAPVFAKGVQPYMISWLKYSPELEIKKLSCPVLILQGSCDIQVKVLDADNLHAANKNSVMDIIPTMTHTLKDAGQDCANQQETYTSPTLPINRILVKDIVNFIKK